MKFWRHFTLLVMASFFSLAAWAQTGSVILVVGDSLSAEYGLVRGTGWVAHLEKQLATSHSKMSVINASISGDTTASGRSRLGALLKRHQPSVTIIELGGNDALRGLPLQQTESNLIQMVREAKASGSKVLLLGMQIPPNYGRQYSLDFSALFATVAKQENTALLPFLLKGVADTGNTAAMFQVDRIHPNAQAQPAIFSNVWPVLKPLIERSEKLK
jgi:acyl-CoA thioesterase I